MNLDELDRLVQEEETDSAAGKTRLVGRNLAAALGFTLLAAAAFAGVALIVMSQLANLASATAQAEISASSYLDGELPGGFQITEAVRTEQIGNLSVVEVDADFDTGLGDAGTATVTVGCEKLLVQRCEVLEANGLPV